MNLPEAFMPSLLPKREALMSSKEDVRPSIDALMRRTLESEESNDPGVIVDRVLAEIPAGQRRHYLRELLLARFSTVAGSLRNDAQVRAMPRVGSTKQNLIRQDYWPAFLNQRITVGGHWFRMADATADDLRAVAQVRREQAAPLLTSAECFDRLADVMDAAGASPLSELDSSAGLIVLGRAA